MLRVNGSQAPQVSDLNMTVTGSASTHTPYVHKFPPNAMFLQRVFDQDHKPYSSPTHSNLLSLWITGNFFFFQSRAYPRTRRLVGYGTFRQALTVSIMQGPTECRSRPSSTAPSFMYLCILQLQRFFCQSFCFLRH